MLNHKNYHDDMKAFLIKNVIQAGFTLTREVALDPNRESEKYDGLIFSIDHKNIVYRKGRITPDRPGAFVSAWQRPASNANNNKPIPLTDKEVDYLFISVETAPETNIHGQAACGLFIFPASILRAKGILSSHKHQGKTGFRVFPPWSKSRGTIATQVFSDSGKRTQRWQCDYFVDIDNNGSINTSKLHEIFR